MGYFGPKLCIYHLPTRALFYTTISTNSEGDTDKTVMILVSLPFLSFNHNS